MTPEFSAKLERYRAEMVRRGIPCDVIEQWLAAALPCATLTMDGEGPVVGHFGGPLLLPPKAPDPEFPFLARLRCADLPERVTGLALPPDGHLLLFAFPDLDGGGEVVHVPEGAVVEQRASASEYYDEEEDALEIVEQYPRGELHMISGVSLPFHTSKETAAADDRRSEDHPWAPYADVHWDLWDLDGTALSPGGRLQLGGHGVEASTGMDPVAAAALTSDETYDPGDWKLLAGWYPRIEGREGFSLHWAIRRQELSARRFDRTNESLHWNP
ncbi:hypothetical protein [Streptomyces anthocyanicus]|uniref:hypothetical protein n=1 Tax=Streptomyces anthocyanicus TaxID=68174 RepID=UPI0037FA786C